MIVVIIVDIVVYVVVVLLLNVYGVWVFQVHKKLLKSIYRVYKIINTNDNKLLIPSTR